METTPSHSSLPCMTPRELFFAFLWVGLSGFGGVLPWAHRMLVEEKKWLSEIEFAELLSIGQTVPGPNIVNMSIMIGARFHGIRGALLAFSGLMFAPIIIVISLGALYERYGQMALVRGAVSGIAAVAAGLVLATAIKMAISQSRHTLLLLIGLSAFIAVGLLRFPLVPVLLGLAPIGYLIASRKS